MRVITNKHGDLLPYSDKTNENVINETFLEDALTTNHTIAANES